MSPRQTTSLRTSSAKTAGGEVIKSIAMLLKQGQTSLAPLDANELVRTCSGSTRSDLIGSPSRFRRSGREPAARIGRPRPTTASSSQPDSQWPRRDGGQSVPDTGTSHRYGIPTACAGFRSDTGCGLPPDAETHFRGVLHHQEKRLGLGLSICTSIVRVHNGRLWGEANVGRVVFHPPLRQQVAARPFTSNYRPRQW